MFKSSLRHIHDPVLLPLKVEVICLSHLSYGVIVSKFEALSHVTEKGYIFHIFILNSYTFRSVIRQSSDDVSVIRKKCDQMCQIKYIIGIKCILLVRDSHHSDVFVKRLLSAGDVPTFIVNLSVI